MALDKKACEFCGWEYQPKSNRSHFCCTSCRSRGRSEERGSIYYKHCTECGIRLPKDRIISKNLNRKPYCVRCQKDDSPAKSRLERDIAEAKKQGISYGQLKARQLPRMRKILYLKKHNGVTLIVRES